MTQPKTSRQGPRGHQAAGRPPREGLATRLREASRRVRRFVQARPGTSLIGALGAGFVLGGGLARPTTRRLLGAGLRFGLQLAIVPLLEGQLSAIFLDPDKDGSRTRTSSTRGEAP
jgi:hypothetical protein